MKPTKRPQGRPRLPESKRRNRYFCVNCTASELKMIETKAKRMGVPMSTLVRTAVEKLNVD
jgi:hypothetical protein